MPNVLKAARKPRNVAVAVDTIVTHGADAFAGMLATSDNSAALAMLAAGPDATPDAEAVNVLPLATDATTDATTDDAAPVTDAKPDASDKRAERAANVLALRILAGNLHRAFDAARVSVPVKASLAFKRQPLTLNRPAGSMRATERQAAALAVAIIAAGMRVPTTDDAAPVTFPRAFTTDAGDLTIENGAGRDALVSGLATFDNAAECFTVTLAGGRSIASLLGSALPATARA